MDGIHDIRTIENLNAERGGLILAGETTDPRWSEVPVTLLGPGGGVDGFLAVVRDRKLQAMTVVGGSGSDRAKRVQRWGGKGWAASGETDSQDFPQGGATGSLQAQGQDVWVGRWETLEQSPLVVALYGGAGQEMLTGLGFWENDSLILAGTTNSRQLPGETNPAPGGASDGFVARLRPETLTAEITRYIGGSGWDEISSLAAVNGDLHVVGATDSPELDLPRLEQAGEGGGLDGLYVLLDPLLTPLRAARWGGPGTDRLLGVQPVVRDRSASFRQPGQARVRLAGVTDEAGWLTSLDGQAMPGGGQDGFELTYAFAHLQVVSPPGLLVGRGLQTLMMAESQTPVGPAGQAGNGLVRIRSADPERVRLSKQPDEPGASEIVLRDNESRDGLQFYVQGWDEPGEVDLILSGAGPAGGDVLPERRYRLRVAPSAIFRRGPGRVVDDLGLTSSSCTCLQLR